jgi:hypothetical protein
MGDGICLGMTKKSYDQLVASYQQMNASGRNYTNNLTIEQFINNTSFGILQAQEQGSQKQNISVVPVVAGRFLICRKQPQRSAQEQII